MKPLWNRDRSVTLKYFWGATIKRTVSGCQTEVLPGSLETKLLPVSITIKSTNKECHHKDTSSECHKRNFNNGVQQSKYLLGMQELKVLPGSIYLTMWCRRYCQRVPQSEEMTGSDTIKRTPRKCNNQNYFQEVSQS